MKKLFLILVFLSAFQLSAFAAVPHLINYQGKLTDSSNNPLNGTYAITFRIYDAETAGSLLWEETQSAVVIQKGVFSVLLGSVTNLNLTFDKAYFLEIKVGNEVMTPRQHITSSGYAIRAEDADTVGGIGVSATPAANKLLPLDNNARIPSGSGLLNNLITVQQANGTTNITTSSQTYVDMQDMSLPVVASEGDKVIIDFSCMWVYGGQNAGDVKFRLLRDNTQLQEGFFASPSAQYKMSATLQYVDTPPSGTYVYKIQWLSISGGPNSNPVATGQAFRNLRIIKIKT